MKIKVVKNILDANEQMAAENKAVFKKKGLTVLNVMASPGAGKTSLILRTIEEPGQAARSHRGRHSLHHRRREGE